MHLCLLLKHILHNEKLENCIAPIGNYDFFCHVKGPYFVQIIQYDEKKRSIRRDSDINVVVVVVFPPKRTVDIVDMTRRTCTSRLTRVHGPRGTRPGAWWRSRLGFQRRTPGTRPLRAQGKVPPRVAAAMTTRRGRNDPRNL